jgi:sortase (surface protein transpeptidase)
MMYQYGIKRCDGAIRKVHIALSQRLVSLISTREMLRGESPVYIKQRCGYLFAIVFLIGSIALNGWVWDKFSPSLQQDNRIVIASDVQSMSMPTPQSSVESISTPTPRSNVQSTSIPIPQLGLDMHAGARLLIPAIGVDAPVEPVGVLSNGALDVPEKNQWTGVGWYKDGPIPGQLGSAIVDGHLDRPGGVPAVFWNLNRLHIGDIVTVMGAQGQALYFCVVQLQAYRPDAAPLDKIFGDASGPYLNLVTCDGQWISSEHQTTLRLVVYTKKV